MSNQIRLSIPGMKCKGCVAAIEKVLSNDIGIAKADVDLNAKTALVEADVPLPVLINALKSAGFDATELAAVDKDVPA